MDIYRNQKIVPEFIYFCKNDKKRLVYQKEPKQIEFSDIVFDTFVQTTINQHDDIQNYDYAILETKDAAIRITDKFLLDNMFQNMKDSFNREYEITKIYHINVLLVVTYTKNNILQKNTYFYNKHLYMLLLTGGISVASFLYLAK